MLALLDSFLRAAEARIRPAGTTDFLASRQAGTAGPPPPTFPDRPIAKQPIAKR
jgi:hypothetical protein